LTYWTSVGAFYAFHYYQKARQQELTAVQLQASLTEARLQMLRCQLNPHFLFNTLNAMSVLVLKGEQETVMEMLVRLSDLLRMTLDETRPQKVPLEEELTLVDRYLAIQAVRFENRLTIERHVAPETAAALVPSMILQPVLENAIEHGVAAECGPSWIAIQTSRENGRLRLEVSDSGPGFHSALPARSGQGIGLVNTRARLEQLYGANQRIEYGRSASGGAAVTIVIPFE
jgi:two-component system LytT family sensor kinase